MNILYISHMDADIAAGLTWSVPAGISAQSIYDKVLWVNQSDAHMDHWDNTGVYHTMKEFGGKLDIHLLPSPFCHPNVVVFEGFYSINEVVFSWQLKRMGIPYIVIPRGSLSKQAFHNHGLFNYLKKKIACALLFKPYTRKALAVQFLTKQEQTDSGGGWTQSPIVIPNGMYIPTIQKSVFSEKGLKIVFIGRPTIHQKGLDVLIESCAIMKSYLIDNHVSITLHAPRKNDYEKLVSMIKQADIEDVLSLKDAVCGKEKETSLLNSDIFIMTSRFEGHPMGLVEALAYGLPVIATPGCNMADEISESNAGWVCDTTVDSLCTLFKRIIEEKAEIPIKGRNARNLALNYRWDRIASDFHKILNNIVK